MPTPRQPAVDNGSVGLGRRSPGNELLINSSGSLLGVFSVKILLNENTLAKLNLLMNYATEGS